MGNADIFVPTKEGMEAAKKRLNERLKKGTTKGYNKYFKELNSGINKLIAKRRKLKNRYYKEKQKNKELDLILKIVIDKLNADINLLNYTELAMCTHNDFINRGRLIEAKQILKILGGIEYKLERQEKRMENER